jgi:tetratricopeptide (TPR) repeat protein
MGAHAPAITQYSRVLALQPGNTRALLRRGLCYHALRDYEAAATDLEAAKRLSPDDPALVSVCGGHAAVSRGCNCSQRQCAGALLGAAYDSQAYCMLGVNSITVSQQIVELYAWARYLVNQWQSWCASTRGICIS